MYLGIDLGTSAVKTCVVSEDGAVAATGSAPLSTDSPFDGASEQSCAAWWQATIDAVRELDPGLRQSVRAIGLSGQMHGAVLLDAQMSPLRPAILWNDSRSSQECRDMIAAEPTIGERSGALPMAGFTAPKVLWLARHAPDLHSKIAHILLPKDFVGLCLHGRLATDPSDASGTCWFDQVTGTWSERFCAVSATDPAWLPPIRLGTDMAGHLRPAAASALGLAPGLPIATGAGDAAAGAVGIGAIAPGDGFLSVGTSGQLFVVTDTYAPNPGARTHAYTHTIQDVRFQMAAMLNGARPMAWLATLLDRPITDLLAEAEHAAPGPLFLPYLTGERTPHGDSDIRGGFALLGETTSQGSLMRGVVEAIAFSFADAVDALGPRPSGTNTLFAIGGGTRSDFLMQCVATVTGCTILRSEGAAVGPAVGAAHLAAAMDTDQPIGTIARKPPVGARFSPDNAGAEAMLTRLKAYRSLYPALKSVQGALNTPGE